MTGVLVSSRPSAGRRSNVEAYPREGAGMCSIHVSSTHTHLQSMGKGLHVRRSVESATKYTGWSSDVAICEASKWELASAKTRSGHVPGQRTF